MNYVSSFLMCFFLLSACSHSPSKNEGVDPARGKSVPISAFTDQDPNHLTIAVVGMNDFHGSLLPRERKLADGRLVYSGGATALASMISILKKEMEGRVLVVDAGDQWQGSMESNLGEGATVVQFYNRLGVQVAAVGNHEFDFGIPTLKKRFKEAHYPYVVSNIFQKKSGKRVTWPNASASRLLTVEGIRFGIIGVTTVETPFRSRHEVTESLDFKEPAVLVQEQASILKKKGAKAVLVTAHAGGLCKDELGLQEWRLWEEKDVQSSCDEGFEINRLIRAIPLGTLDGVVAGHLHQIMHRWIDQVPVIEDQAYSQYFNIIYYTFDRKTHERIPSLTRIEGLIPVCTQVFEGLNHCDEKRLSAGTKPRLVPAFFHGVEVKPDPATEAWLAPIVKRTEKFRHEVLGQADQPLLHLRDRESAMGNLVADALREYAHSDFAVIGSGGIRTSIEAGPITYDSLYRALPFDNFVSVLKLTGKQVKLLCRIGVAGQTFISEFSGLKMKMIPYGNDAPREDLNGDGKKDIWETNRVLELTLSDGSPIDDQKIYTVATTDFLIHGGDDFAWFMQGVPKQQILFGHSLFYRDVVANVIRQRKVVNTSADPLVDPKNPRVELITQK